MNPITRRAFGRCSAEARIQYAEYNEHQTENFSNAKMYNNGEGGMYFESSDPLKPGTDILIKVIDSGSNDHPPEARNGYRAEVMWCQKINKENQNSSYGVGVRFMVNVCDHCGRKMDYSRINVTENFLFFCPPCFEHHLQMEEGKIKECIESYMMGNVI